MQPSVARRALRALALVPGVLLVTAAGPAFAVAPDSGAWPAPENDSKIEAILLLGGIPLLLFVGIWVLAALPTIIGGQKFDATVAFRENPEWFGGPRRGVDAAPDDASEPQGRGGTSANW